MRKSVQNFAYWTIHVCLCLCQVQSPVQRSRCDFRSLSWTRRKRWLSETSTTVCPATPAFGMGECHSPFTAEALSAWDVTGCAPVKNFSDIKWKFRFQIYLWGIDRNKQGWAFLHSVCNSSCHPTAWNYKCASCQQPSSSKKCIFFFWKQTNHELGIMVRKSNIFMSIKCIVLQKAGEGQQLVIFFSFILTFSVSMVQYNFAFFGLKRSQKHSTQMKPYIREISNIRVHCFCLFCIFISLFAFAFSHLKIKK